MARFSHSALNKYLSCPKSYQYHYINKYRSAEMSAALLFGTAIDKSTENYAQNRNRQLAFDTFTKTWDEQELNGKPTKLQSCTEIVYGNNDLDLELLDQSDYDYIAKIDGYENVLEAIDNVLKRKDEVGFKYLKKAEKTLLNRTNWICMQSKGALMLDAFINWFDANVEEVLKTQGKIELVQDLPEDEWYQDTFINGQGEPVTYTVKTNTVVGFFDLVVKLRGRQKPVLLDIKTSGRAYDWDAVLKSPQLALYLFATKHEYHDTNTAGYVVLHKTMKKERTKICSVCGFDGSGAQHRKCNNETEQMIPDRKGVPQKKMARCNGEWIETVHSEAVIQVLVNEVPELLQERVAENYDMMAKAVKAEIYPRNYGSCVQYNGTVTCPYYDLCHKNCMKNIIVKDEDKK